ncbi:MAG TPA: carboxypeptidase-like regulatory domain-containing protein [Planctomycetota bacterium]|nr:carboxypeptidase-like regulatory domain-containing protein [Planctomycetota bacterium]
MHKLIAHVAVIGLFMGISTHADAADRLTGLVVDEDAKPLDGATVTAFQAAPGARDEEEHGQVGSVVTGPDGRFVFEPPVDASSVTVVAGKEGKCLDWAYPSLQRYAELRLQLGPAALIEGEVVDDTGRPLAGVTVDALLRLELPAARQMYSPLPGQALKARTDAQGRFRFTNLPRAATITFDLCAPGHARALADGHFLPGQKGLRFVLPPEGRIEGTVVEEATARPLADVRLSAMGSVSSGMHHTSTTTDKDGHFSLTGLSGGKYSIEITGVGEALPDWIGSQDKVQVEPGKTSAVKIEATTGGTLEFVLTDIRVNVPVSIPARISVSPMEDLRIREPAFAAKGGVARLYLRPGDYVVTDVWIVGFSYAQEKGKSFQVHAGKTERFALPLKPVPQVTGVVRDPAGKPVAGAQVRLLPLAGAAKDLLADDQGRFSIDSADIGPLFCFVSVRHPQHNLVALEVVGRGEPPPEVTLQPPVQVTGVVLDSRGRPVAGAKVQAQISGSHLGRFAVVAAARTERDGLYRMELAGMSLDYVLSAAAPGYTLTEMLIPQHQLAQGQGKMKVIVLQSADRVVRGLVVDPEGKPLAGVIISAKSMGGPQFPDSAVTDAGGRFTLEHLSNDPVIYLFAKAPGRGWINTGSNTIGPGDREVVIRVGPSPYD